MPLSTTARSISSGVVVLSPLHIVWLCRSTRTHPAGSGSDRWGCRTDAVGIRRRYRPSIARRGPPIEVAIAAGQDPVRHRRVRVPRPAPRQRTGERRLGDHRPVVDVARPAQPRRGARHGARLAADRDRPPRLPQGRPAARSSTPAGTSPRPRRPARRASSTCRPTSCSPAGRRRTSRPTSRSPLTDYARDKIDAEQAVTEVVPGRGHDPHVAPLRHHRRWRTLQQDVADAINGRTDIDVLHRRGALPGTRRGRRRGGDAARGDARHLGSAARRRTRCAQPRRVRRCAPHGMLGLDPSLVRTATLAESGLVRPGHVVLDSSRAADLGIHCRPVY